MEQTLRDKAMEQVDRMINDLKKRIDAGVGEDELHEHAEEWMSDLAVDVIVALTLGEE